MEKIKENIARVEKILGDAPRGMTISEVAKKMGVNRNAVAKYLEVLRTSGDVEMRSFGRAKIFSLSGRIPLATALSLSSDLIVLIDTSLIVIDANDQFLQFAGVSREDVIGRMLENNRIDILSHPNVLLNVRDALGGKEFVREIKVTRGRNEHHFKIKILPVETSNRDRRAAVLYENITARKKAEIALNESEARYRAVVEDQADLIVRMLPDTTITFVNDAWCRHFRAGKDMIVGKKHIDLIPDAYRSAFLRDMGSIRPQNPSLTVEAAIVMPDGKALWIQYHYRGIFGEKGRLAEVQIVARDVTERRLAEESLAEAEGFKRSILDSLPSNIAVLDGKGVIVYVNESWMRFARENGASAEYATGRGVNYLDVCRSATGADYEEAPEALKGMLAVLRGELETFEMEYPCHSPDTRRWFQMRVTPFDGGRYRGIVVYHNDITNRKKAEETLRVTQISVDKAIDEVNWVSPEGLLLYVNEACSRKLGYTREELLSMYVWEFDPLFTMEKYRSLMNSVRENGHEEFKSVHRARNGREYPVDIKAIYLPMGEKECLCAYVRDISDRAYAAGSPRNRRA